MFEQLENSSTSALTSTLTSSPTPTPILINNIIKPKARYIKIKDILKLFNILKIEYNNILVKINIGQGDWLIKEIIKKYLQHHHDYLDQDNNKKKIAKAKAKAKAAIKKSAAAVAAAENNELEAEAAEEALAEAENIVLELERVSKNRKKISSPSRRIRLSKRMLLPLSLKEQTSK